MLDRHILLETARLLTTSLTEPTNASENECVNDDQAVLLAKSMQQLKCQGEPSFVTNTWTSQHHLFIVDLLPLSTKCVQMQQTTARFSQDLHYMR